MGNRGSKSSKLTKIQDVKEQRVNGSWCFNNIKNSKQHLRYTLMNYESNYQVRNPF